jgi:hypothetical protein
MKTQYIWLIVAAAVAYYLYTKAQATAAATAAATAQANQTSGLEDEGVDLLNELF